MTEPGSDPNLFLLRAGPAGEGAPPPLFFIVAPGVNALGYGALVRGLPADRAAYVVQPKRGGRKFPNEGIGPGGRDEYVVVAAEYLASLRAVQPRGPYYLAGMCDGALLAFEMARALEAQGQRVGLLAVLDTWPLENTSFYPLVLVNILAKSWVRRTPEERRGLARRKVDEALTRSTALFRVARVARVAPSPGPAEVKASDPLPADSLPPEGSPERKALWRARVWPGRRFVAPVIAAPIAVLRAPEQPYWRLRDDALGWRGRTTGMVTVHILPGRHLTWLQAPNVENISRTLAAYLDHGALAAPPPAGPPPVSAICLPSGNAEQLEEAIESFLRQDYPGKKELIVLEDDPRRRWVLSHPQVRVVNVPGPFHSLGEKYRAAAALCAHDLTLVWADTDIHLPHRISLSVARLDRDKGFFRTDLAWSPDLGLTRLTRLPRLAAHGGSLWSRRLLVEVDGYPHVDTAPEIGFERRCEAAHPGCTAPAELDAEDVYLLHRPPAPPSSDTGDLPLTPRWRDDYRARVREALASPALSRPLPTPPEEPDLGEPARATEEPDVAAPRPSYPPVSAVCLTYGRPQVLEESLQAFLLQDYPGPKELVILNDYEGQTLVFDHPEVRVINVPRRFRTLGEKRNAAVALCSHDLLFVWDDDDIYLPHRFSLSLLRFPFQKGFWKPANAWQWNRGRLVDDDRSLYHAGSSWSRWLFDAVGGYPAMGAGEDAAIEKRFRKHAKGTLTTPRLPSEDLYYIYRWQGTASYHLSAHEPGDNSGHDEVARYVRTEAARGRIPRGRVVLEPRWKWAYVRRIVTQLQVDAARRARESTPLGKLRATLASTWARSTGRFDALMKRAAGDLER